MRCALLEQQQKPKRKKKKIRGTIQYDDGKAKGKKSEGSLNVRIKTAFLFYLILYPRSILVACTGTVFAFLFSPFFNCFKFRSSNSH